MRAKNILEIILNPSWIANSLVRISLLDLICRIDSNIYSHHRQMKERRHIFSWFSCLWRLLIMETRNSTMEKCEDNLLAHTWYRHFSTDIRCLCIMKYLFPFSAFMCNMSERDIEKHTKYSTSVIHDLKNVEKKQIKLIVAFTQCGFLIVCRE